MYVVLHSSLVRTNREDTYVYIRMLSIPILTHLLAVLILHIRTPWSRYIHVYMHNKKTLLQESMHSTRQLIGHNIDLSVPEFFLSHCYTGHGAGIAVTNSPRLGLASRAAVLFVSHEVQLVVSPQVHSESFTVCVYVYSHNTVHLQCVLGSPSLHSLVAHVELLSSSQCSRY